MAINVLSTCATAADESGVTMAATFLTILFSVYIGMDSLLSAVIITRKASEAEKAAFSSQAG
jgi:hypothetical protein